jgi:hypothetical protein
MLALLICLKYFPLIILFIDEEEELENLGEEAKQRRLMEQSCANVESLFRHLWATLPGFCTNPLDLSPVNEEPYLLANILLQVHTQWNQFQESFNVHLISLYRGSMYKGLSALCKSISGVLSCRI